VEMLDEVLPIIRSGVLPRRKQDDSHATVMPKRRPEDGVINWNRTTQEIYNWVRALTDPYPGAFSLLNGDRVWVWTARADGAPIDGESRGPGEVIVDSDGWPWVFDCRWMDPIGNCSTRGWSEKFLDKLRARRSFCLG